MIDELPKPEELLSVNKIRTANYRHKKLKTFYDVVPFLVEP